MSLTVEERMAQFLGITKEQALNSERAHKGNKTEILKELDQCINHERTLATPASLRLLNKKLKTFEQKCEDIELAIEHLCAIAQEKQGKSNRPHNDDDRKNGNRFGTMSVLLCQRGKNS